MTNQKSHAPWPAPFTEFAPSEVGNPWGDSTGDHVAGFLIFALQELPQPLDMSETDPYEAGVVVERWKYQPAVSYNSQVRPAIPGEVFYVQLGRDEYVGTAEEVSRRLTEWMLIEGLLSVDDLVAMGLRYDDVDAAAKVVQDVLGVTDGGLAGMMLSADNWREDFPDYVRSEFDGAPGFAS